MSLRLNKIVFFRTKFIKYKIIGKCLDFNIFYIPTILIFVWCKPCTEKCD